MRTAEGEAAMDPGAFPALERLARRSRCVPFVAQLEVGRLRRRLPGHGAGATTAAPSQLDEVRAPHRRRSGRRRRADRSLQGAEQLGLRGRGVRIEVEDAGHLPAGVDPALGVQPLRRPRARDSATASTSWTRRSAAAPCRWSASASSFTGVALVLEPAAALGAGPDRSRPLPALHAADPGAACAAGRACSASRSRCALLALAVPC